MGQIKSKPQVSSSDVTASSYNVNPPRLNYQSPPSCPRPAKQTRIQMLRNPLVKPNQNRGLPVALDSR